MSASFSVEDFKDKFDSLYRLVIVASRRANQITKNESHGFGAVTSGVKPTMLALQEVLDDKVGYFTGRDEDEAFLE